MSNRKDDKSFKSLFASCHVFHSSYLVMRLAACYLHVRELPAAGEFSENVMDAHRQTTVIGCGEAQALLLPGRGITEA